MTLSEGDCHTLSKVHICRRNRTQCADLLRQERERVMSRGIKCTGDVEAPLMPFFREWQLRHIPDAAQASGGAVLCEQSTGGGGSLSAYRETLQ